LQGFRIGTRLFAFAKTQGVDVMATVQVFQRNAHLAGAVKLEFVNGREGPIAKAVLTAISSVRRGAGDAREEEATAIQWTLWGKQAENAAEYLGKGSHVNIVGRLRNNRYEKAGEVVYGFDFTADEVDYLDSRAESEARRARDEPSDAPAGGAGSSVGANQSPGAGSRRSPRRPARAGA
jgi:single-strand DNA-binding protein